MWLSIQTIAPYLGCSGMVDMVLPFGLHSAPFIFTSIADLVEWILVRNYGMNFLRHYLDDFFTLGRPSSQICHSYLLTLVHLCQMLGLPLYPDKLEGPATCLTILGIELDSHRLQAHFPTEKRVWIVALLEEWSTKHFCKRRELESLIGHLPHTCKVAPQGRAFLRRMIDLVCAFHLDDHQAKPRITTGAYLVAGVFSDLEWPQFLLHAHVGAHPGLPSLLRCSRLPGLRGYF